ncbi:acyl-CoA synthetase (AMP-forming)/AMP-acid ligase II [Humitalea rosea]|uniref:Acyl-CoA synthetase (AMP-forming)/AMP-acid ligase II n=1 Tax=Humitalea rosea TaxID=990373 RepID=A0A2W7IGY0_9PROT|nr:AMP-binding protein [Humitalea rosea]PZW45934.1 acyl-CoA synthetase (AMP-forming)/AMP-acid ligase II [Humitalea rosea]
MMAANLGRLLTQTARRLPDAPGLIWRDRVWAWAEVDTRVDRLTQVLRENGVTPGDRVLVHSRNSAAMFESLWACFKLGAIWVPTNFRLTPSEVAILATDSRPVAMIRDQGFAAHADAVPSARCILAVGDARAHERDYEAALAAVTPPPPDHEAPVSADTPCWFFFTSGTTGRPKAAVLTHGQMGFVVTNHLADLMPGLTEHGASLVIAPLSHGAGIHALANVARGAPSILLPGEALDVPIAWGLIAQHRVTNMFTVPTILMALCDGAPADADASSLRHVIYAGAPMYRADQDRARKLMGHAMTQYFGLGEVTGNITVLRPDQHDLAPGSCGMARTGMEIGILDATGARLPPETTGEICVRGPAVFAGYFENPEASQKAFTGGWFHTGDIGYLDARGFLFITGRASDMFISGGSNVYPREIEEAILLHPAIAECAVVGIPHPKWGEVGVACLVARAPVGEAEIRAHLQARLARYKHPQVFVFWDSLPKSGYGKVPKSLLKQRLAEEGVTPPPPA